MWGMYLFVGQINMFVCGAAKYICGANMYVYGTVVTRGLMKEGTFRTRKAFYLQKFFRRQILLVLLRFNSKGD